MNLVYEEKQSITPIFTVVSVIIVIVLVVQLLFFPEIRNDKGFFIVAPLIVLLMFFMVINFYALKIKISETQLQFGFGLFKKKFFIKNLQDIAIEDYKFNVYGGYGIRYGRNKRTGFIARGGQGIIFLEQNTNKKFYISTNNPEQVLTLLIQYGAQKK